ncbi:MAG: DNA-binding protein WhiA [Clostridia bacterium]|nr:DNA-binding protein WhiA [Clostridia bacterium]
MTFSEKVKNEIISKFNASPCCKIANLSAFVRGSGTIESAGGFVGFEIVTENEVAFNAYKDILVTLFGAELDLKIIKDKLTKKNKYSLTFLSSKSLSVLVELGILSVGQDGITLNLSIDKYVVENDCCVKEYIKGAFIGSGSVTVPSLTDKKNKGYHLEFVFSKYQTADDFSLLLTSQGFLPKLIERKERYVIYFKNAEEISDILAYMGATKSCFALNDVIIEKDIRNDTNRKVNCEIGNLNKQVEASIKQTKNISIIIETVGLDSLSKELKDTANARLQNPDATLDELAEILKVSKSCANHRLRKLNEIAKNIIN